MENSKDYWKGRLMSIGYSREEAEIMARIKVQMIKDAGLIGNLKKNGYQGFLDWLNGQPRDIVAPIVNFLKDIYAWIKSQF